MSEERAEFRYVIYGPLDDLHKRKSVLFGYSRGEPAARPGCMSGPEPIALEDFLSPTSSHPDEHEVVHEAFEKAQSAYLPPDVETKAKQQEKAKEEVEETLVIIHTKVTKK